MPLGRALLLAVLVGCALNPQRALLPSRVRLPPGIRYSMKFRTRSDAIRHFAGTLPKGGGKLGRKAKRAAATAYVKQAIREGHARG